MRLYSGLSSHFIRDTVHNQIGEKLKEAFFHYYRYQPSPGEVNSWRNSLRAVSQVFDLAGFQDQGVILEYQLPLTSKRLDCLVCGKDGAGKDNAVIVELKQWECCGEASGENLVTTWVGGAQREILHPSAQVRQYQRYLEDSHTAFYDAVHPIHVSSCAYLHNYHPKDGDVIFSDPFRILLQEAPAFTADDVDPLKNYLVDRLHGGDGLPVLRRIEESKYRPSKKLMDHVGNMIKGKSEYVLLDEQFVVYNKVLACAREGFHDRRKTVLIVKGGPGTGKSVIAINLMSDLLLAGYNAHYATGSRAFTETLRKVIGPRGEVQFKYFNSYGEAQPNEIDVLICDESHRIRETSNSRFTPRKRRRNKPQVQELLAVAKVGVFFIDDKQAVRPNEIGSVSHIRKQASGNNCRIFEYELEAQYRCAGSDGFVNWVNNTLGIQRTANVLWNCNDAFDFRIFDSPEALEAAIRMKATEGHRARLTAGFCWPWSKPKNNGTLVEDVRIGEYHHPWNAKPGTGRLAPGIPSASLWAHDPNGINQIGCVYTAQGFEFDYVGVIFGPDLTYNFTAQNWEGHPEKSHDSEVRRGREQFCDLVKNTYRVLLSRGLIGCYVYFMDKDTERFVKSRIEIAVQVEAGEETGVPQLQAAELPPEESPYPFRMLPAAEARPFENCVPLYELKVAAGAFSGGSVTEVLQEDEINRPTEFTWVELPDAFRPRRGLFVARVVGESMNRQIPNGAWCLFRLSLGGTRQGKVVLVQHRAIDDPETGGDFTVKVYESEKKKKSDGTWRHAKIILRPDTTAPGYEPIVLSAKAGEDLKVIAELVAVLG